MFKPVEFGVHTIIETIELAKRAHSGQVRKYTERPYIEHPMRVAGLVSLIDGVQMQHICAAWLHDLIEDQPNYEPEFGERFPYSIYSLVQNLTNASMAEEHRGKPRRERKEIDIRHLVGCGLWTKIIKLCDRLDNLRDMSLCERKFLRLYCDESYRLVDALTLSDPDARLAFLGGEVYAAAARLVQASEAANAT